MSHNGSKVRLWFQPNQQLIVVGSTPKKARTTPLTAQMMALIRGSHKVVFIDF